MTVIEVYRHGVRTGQKAERERIIALIQSYGYEWSHDPTYSPLQHLLNRLHEEQNEEDGSA